jgi:hypothetical protein
VCTINDFASASMSLPATGLLTVGHSPTSRRSRQSLMNVGAPQIKPQLGTEPSEESLYVVGGFSDGISDVVDGAMN